jgi:dienelactone hydrolase
MSILIKTLSLFLLVGVHSFAFGASCNSKLETYKMTDPIDHGLFEISAKVYRPKVHNQKKISTIFIIPTIIGESVIDRRMANKFCSNGMAVYLLDVVKDIPTEEEIQNFEVHDDLYVRALAAMRTVISALKADAQLNGKFGILGMSQGGMISAFIAGSESDIQASVIVVGAGNVPGVLAYSDQARITEIRNSRMKQFNIKDQESYQQVFKDLVPHDPISVAANIRPGSMYMFIANNDTTVPTKFQQELRQKVPDPLVYEMRANHFTGILKAGSIHAGKITSFFLKQLSLRN